ncbi:MAG: DUF892 family protein [Balneolaceae bacterium]|nr:DUF892 family protein [Balneolaceae bacterium]
MGSEVQIFDLYDLMLEQLRDLYDGEKQQLDLLPELDKKAYSFELKEIIEWHKVETERQINRLESVFNLIREEPGGEECDGIRGLIREAQKLRERCKNPQVSDAAIITAIQHINHYEIAGYGTAVAYAKALDRHDVAELLLDSLREEKQADYGLSDLAEGQINPDAKWSSLIKKIESESREKKSEA